jgi:hypothetical protein
LGFVAVICRSIHGRGHVSGNEQSVNSGCLDDRPNKATVPTTVEFLNATNIDFITNQQRHTGGPMWGRDHMEAKVTE